MSRLNTPMLRGSDGLPLSPLGLAALVAIPISIGLVIVVALPLRSILAPAPSQGDGATPPPEGTSVAQLMDGHLAQVNGRSLFSIPDSPAAEPEDRGPKPTVYAGPALIAMIDGAAWFGDGTRAALNGEEQNGIRVLSFDPPWRARVLWQGGEFDVELFKKTDFKSLRETIGAEPPKHFSPRSQRVRRTGPGLRAPGPTLRAPGQVSPNVPPGPGAAAPSAGQSTEKSKAPAPTPGDGSQPNEQPGEDPQQEPGDAPANGEKPGEPSEGPPPSQGDSPPPAPEPPPEPEPEAR